MAIRSRCEKGAARSQESRNGAPLSPARSRPLPPSSLLREAATAMLLSIATATTVSIGGGASAGETMSWNKPMSFNERSGIEKIQDYAQRGLDGAAETIKKTPDISGIGKDVGETLQGVKIKLPDVDSVSKAQQKALEGVGSGIGEALETMKSTNVGDTLQAVTSRLPDVDVAKAKEQAFEGVGKGFEEALESIKTMKIPDNIPKQVDIGDALESFKPNIRDLAQSADVSKAAENAMRLKDEAIATVTGLQSRVFPNIQGQLDQTLKELKSTLGDPAAGAGRLLSDVKEKVPIVGSLDEATSSLRKTGAEALTSATGAMENAAAPVIRPVKQAISDSSPAIQSVQKGLRAAVKTATPIARDLAEKAGPAAETIRKSVETQLPIIRQAIADRAPGVWSTITTVVKQLGRFVLFLINTIAQLAWGMFKAVSPDTATSMERSYANTLAAAKSTIALIQGTVDSLVRALNSVVEALRAVVHRISDFARPGVEFVMAKTQPIRKEVTLAIDGITQEVIRTSTAELHNVEGTLLNVASQAREKIADAVLGVEGSELVVEGRQEALHVAEGVLEGASSALGSAKEEVDAVVANMKDMEMVN